MSDLSHQVSRRSFWITAVAVLGTFLVFSIVLWVGYLPARQQPTPPVANLDAEARAQNNVLTPDERKQRLVELRSREQQALAHYAWIDQAAGVVRLPIDRAIEVFVRENNPPAPQPAASRPAAPNR